LLVVGVEVLIVIQVFKPIQVDLVVVVMDNRVLLVPEFLEQQIQEVVEVLEVLQIIKMALPVMEVLELF
jgi:hypothetical protein